MERYRSRGAFRDGPNAQNADDKALLQEVRGRVEQHLKTAQDLQAKLGK